MTARLWAWFKRLPQRLSGRERNACRKHMSAMDVYISMRDQEIAELERQVAAREEQVGIIRAINQHNGHPQQGGGRHA